MRHWQAMGARPFADLAGVCPLRIEGRGNPGGVHVGGEKIMEMPRVIRGEIDTVILTVYAEANDF